MSLSLSLAGWEICFVMSSRSHLISFPTFETQKCPNLYIQFKSPLILINQIGQIILDVLFAEVIYFNSKWGPEPIFSDNLGDSSTPVSLEIV